MTTLPQDTLEAPPGEGLRRTMLCLVYLGAVAVAVLFSPAMGLWHPQHAPTHLAAAEF